MVERLRGLGLTAMADAFIGLSNQSAADDLSREDWLGLLVDREVTARGNKRLGRVNSMIRITGIGGHDPPDWLIRINGIRSLRRTARALHNSISNQILAQGPTAWN
jgi:hypothetical protein